tara:strand:- start:5645 stop:6370 length:726 start_codon:yes stop_codon:yes gene_type:complete
MKLKYTTEMIDKTIARASKISWGRDGYMKKRFAVLQDLRLKMENTAKPLTEPQINYLNSLMEVFSDKMLDQEENWSTEWNSNPELRERADVASKYYIAQRGWYMQIAQDIQRILASEKLVLEVPDWNMTTRMINNEYAEKVWENHKAPHRWKAGELVCCRANAGTNGWNYFTRTEGINVYKDPCMVIESGSKPISKASKHDKKRGGCRWVAINPVGSDHIFHVMEKDLKIYRPPKKKGKKK